MSKNHSRGRTALLVLMLVATSIFGIQAAVSAASAEPFTGNAPSPTNLTVYFHNLTSPVTIGGLQVLDIADTWNDTAPQYASTGANITALHYLALNFTLSPQLAGPLFLNGTVYSWIWMTQSGSAPQGGSIKLTVLELAPSGSTTSLGTGPGTSMSNGYPGSSPTTIMLTGPTLNTTVPSNDSLAFQILVSGNTGETYSAQWGYFASTYYTSRVSLSASSYLEVGSIYALNSSGLPAYALSQTASNKTIKVTANFTDPLGQYDFASYPVNYTIENETGYVLGSGVMASSTPYDPLAYSRLYTFSFNYSAMAVGPLFVNVNGTDNTMHNYLTASGVLYGRNAFGTLQLYVGTPPVNANFTVTDRAGNPVAGAVVQITQLSFSVGSTTTSAAGIASMALSQGNYTATVDWQSVSVGSFAVSVTNSSSNFTLRAHIYSPVFNFDDYSGTALSYAQVELTSPAGHRLPLMYSSANGSLALNEMAGGEYLTVIFWHGSMVFNGTISFDSNGVIAVNVNAYEQAFSVVSSSGSPVATANVVIVNQTTGIYVGFNTTNASGMASSVIPYGVYGIQVYWKGIVVYDAVDVTLNNPTAGTMTISAHIYDVTVQAVSTSGAPLQDVVVSLSSSTTGAVISALTGSNGKASFTVAAGNYTLTSSFSGTYDLTPVSQTITKSLSVNQSSTLTLKFTKVYPSITSTYLFYVGAGVVVVIVIAAGALLVAVRKFRSSRQK